MSNTTSRFNPWIATVIMGVVTILFSLYAFQAQTELMKANEEVAQWKLKYSLTQAEAGKKIQESEMRANLANEEAQKARFEAEECRKSKRK